jgi:putative redox protein
MSIDSRTETSGQFKQRLTIDRHTLYADMPIETGGGAAGPGAHDYFDASLAACKALTAMIYARSHGLALDRVNIHIDRDDSRERQGVYVLQVRVGFEGALSEAEKSKLLEIVGRCPVHKLMTSATIDIRTSPL